MLTNFSSTRLLPGFTPAVSTGNVPHSQRPAAQTADSISIRFGAQTPVQTELVKKLLKSHEGFSSELMQEMADEATGKTLAWSSWNLYGLLMSIAGGAKQEYKDRLGIPVDANTSQAEVNQAFKARIHDIVTEAEKKEITLRNDLGVWVVQRGEEADPKKLMTSNFKTNAEA